MDVVVNIIVVIIGVISGIMLTVIVVFVGGIPVVDVLVMVVFIIIVGVSVIIAIQPMYFKGRCNTKK
jgi:hypothetical protein